MFDIEKLRAKGIDERQIAICQSINENNAKEESCSLHDFERIKVDKYQCKNCGCVKESYFVNGYMIGLKHGRAQ